MGEIRLGVLLDELKKECDELTHQGLQEAYTKLQAGELQRKELINSIRAAVGHATSRAKAIVHSHRSPSSTRASTQGK